MPSGQVKAPESPLDSLEAAWLKDRLVAFVSDAGASGIIEPGTIGNCIDEVLSVIAQRRYDAEQPVRETLDQWAITVQLREIVLSTLIGMLAHRPASLLPSDIGAALDRAFSRLADEREKIEARLLTAPEPEAAPESPLDATGDHPGERRAPVWLMPDNGLPLPGDPPGASGFEYGLMLMSLSRILDAMPSTDRESGLTLLKAYLSAGLASVYEHRHKAQPSGLADTLNRTLYPIWEDATATAGDPATSFAEAIRTARERVVDARSDLRERQADQDSITALRIDHIIRTKADAGIALGSNDTERKRNLEIWASQDEVIRIGQIALEGSRVALDMAEVELEHIRDQRRDYENSIREREVSDQ